MTWRAAYRALCDLAQDVHQRTPELGERMTEALGALRMGIRKDARPLEAIAARVEALRTEWGDGEEREARDAIAAEIRRLVVPLAVDDETAIERMARAVARHAGEDFDAIGGLAQGVLLETQREALKAARGEAP